LRYLIILSHRFQYPTKVSSEKNLFIQRRLSTQDKITKQQQNDNVTTHSKVPIKVQNIQNIKSKYWKFMSSSWGPARVTSLKWKICHTSKYSQRWLTDTGSVTYLELRAYLGQKKSVAQNYLFIAILCAKISCVTLRRVNFSNTFNWVECPEPLSFAIFV